ncbi:hypothetical protein AGOR_G00189580 [Albula goreensis]|uniref:Peptidase metallopeptidase domain-containing protein n=1 Tax=Albula goreensis TaxID=1534307 RepID=A0A8T3CY98_9TELE|nr:hypothetical protein AGOR_G00189580 [Albula goreensis]
MAADHKSGISISGKEDLKDGNTNLTYSISGKCKRIDDKEVCDIIARAFKVWADVSLLTFRPVDADANIKLSFEDGDHFTEGDPTHSNPLSESETGGLIHFDDDENWKGMKDQSKGGINLFLAAVHEIGHVLGLPDKDFQKTSMYKSYANDKTFALNKAILK